MPIPQNFSRIILDYLPAKLTEGKEWFVSFHVINPLTNKLHRKKIKVNRIKSVAERRKYARQLVHEINIKLAHGWNPFYEQESPKAFHKLFDVIDTFLAEKEKELREDSIRSYKSYCKIFRHWIETHLNTPAMYVINFNQQNAILFMDYIYTEKDVSSRMFNNYKSFFVLFFNWAVKKLYCKINPFLCISKKKEEPKKRDMIDEQTRYKIFDYLKTNDFEYLAMCMMTFYCLIRPKEITYIKVKDVDLKNQVVKLDAKFTKNGKSRSVTIPDNFIPHLQRIIIHPDNKNDYLFSDDFKQGNVYLKSRKIGKRWEKLRKILGLPAEYQFYSLKDTGIVEMLNAGVSPEAVRKQADHHSLEMTTVYSNHVNPRGNEQIKNFSGN